MAAINIYVGNLSFNTGEDQLRELFESYGQVESATIISDKFTGRPRGFGFVKMPEREEGLKAIQELDSKDFMERNIKVNEARPRTDRDRGDRQGGGGGGRGKGGGGGGWR
ncbi:MAG: RNA-binding protein [Deltaproteobacteria bacterium]|nr:RNA-binding protein [Deltaproteobacteria bacterium]